jgi:hypothetical protein
MKTKIFLSSQTIRHRFPLQVLLLLLVDEKVFDYNGANGTNGACYPKATKRLSSLIDRVVTSYDYLII